MNLRVAFQMDSPEKLDIKSDTSLYLMQEAQRRNYSIWVYQPDSLTYSEGKLTSKSRKLDELEEDPFSLSFHPEKEIDLEKEIDIILMRQDPPFDMSYLTAAHLLEIIQEKTLIVNNPFWVRSSPEKLLPLDFCHLIPPSLVSRDIEAIKAFRKKHERIILKPLYGNGGEGIFYLKADDSNFLPLLEMFFKISKEPIMAQAFLPSVTEGDKRIILIDGEAIGAINRLPPKGEIRSNMHIGGLARKTSLDKRDLEICQTLSPVLKERGLILTGIDVIGGWLTEINVTSPTGTRALKQLSGINSAVLFWEAVLKRLL